MYSKLLRTKLAHLTPLRTYQTRKEAVQHVSNTLAKNLHQRIKATGPLTVAEYMKQVLTHPGVGYYMHRDVFGEQGDFITSPEISQMFGEMLGVWMLNEWQKFGSPTPLQFVEMGPGRGTLSADILKVFGHFDKLNSASLHLVECSPALSEIQARKLCTTYSNISDSKIYRDGKHKSGLLVKWYQNLADVPKGFSIYLAHEFFDALPIHKFHKTNHGFREVLIDIDEETDKLKFRYVLAKNKTPMLKYVQNEFETRNHIEISPNSMVICENVCKRIVENGGMALFCDYGHNGEGTDTFRAFKKHKQVNPLENPGEHDLTADVDFKMFRQVADKVGGVLTYGPAQQRNFLLKVGLEYRMKSLLKSMDDDDQAGALRKSYDMLTSPDKMGSRFKFFAMFPETLKKVLDKFPVVGF